jgi:molybdopterin-containing oxidoreductase family iron-sulfur binding subunit
MIELDVIDPKEADQEASKYRFWRDPDELSSSEHEPENPNEEFHPGQSDPPSGASRRQFLQLMGAAMAMAGLTGCRRPAEKILPYARKPEEVIPGVSQMYATAMPFRGDLRPILVESHEGRPTKVEGNGDHPVGQTGTSPYEQASILNLYDPDRSASVLREGSQASWSDFVTFCRGLADNAADRSVAVLAEPSSSPTMQAMRQRLEGRFPNLTWIEYATDGDDPVAMGMQQAFGRPLRPRYDFAEAEAVLSLDADFLAGDDRSFYHNTQSFAESRRVDSVEDDMSRLFAIESTYTTTGGLADNRMGLKASRIPAFAAAVAAELGVGQAPQADWDERERLYVREIASDLQSAGRRGIVLAGDSQPPEVHALAMALNQRLGSVGETVTLLDPGDETVASQEQALADLTDRMNAGDVDLLLTLGVNPVYDAPAELGFEQAMQNVDETVHSGLLVDETARASRWHLPRAHYLEAWGDGRSYDGTLSIVQPMIAPLYDDAHSGIEIVNALATGTDTAGYDLVREQWRGTFITSNFENRWREALHDGYLEDTAYASASVSRASVPQISAPSSGAGTEDLEVVFRLDPKALDGRFSNNAWMQELPDPLTKIVWDNVALMSPATAEALGLERVYENGNYRVDRIELSVNGESVELPIWVLPGLPDGTINLNYGYGRQISSTREPRSTPFWDTDDQTDIYNYAPIAGGIDDDGDPIDVVGANVSPLKPLGSRVATGASVRKVDSGYLIASTQEETSTYDRPIVRWATLEEFKENPYFVDDVESPVPNLHGDHGGDGHGGGHGGDSHGGGHGDGHGGSHQGDGAATGMAGGDGAAHGDGAHANGSHGASADTIDGTDDFALGPVVGLETGPEGHGAENAQGFRDYPTMWQNRHPKDTPDYRDNPYYDNQWGMVIDLNTCTGCNACVVACTSENNVQVVGKEEVSQGRHMYWLRNDRYFVSHEGNENNPEMMTQPVMCQHCENAPCESVCPVAATVHSPDGTNQMIYNRCIGTRYCSNNCPYKVRRFNFYNWTKTLPAEVQMAQNPNVTVRSRGVMEKCSWCIHRVRDAQSQADNEDRDLRPNEIETACQQACPTDAITFGDLNNADSDVVEQKQNPRRYELLAYLNVKPRLSYLGRVRNPNPRIAEYEEASGEERAEDDAVAAAS